MTDTERVIITPSESELREADPNLLDQLNTFITILTSQSLYPSVVNTDQVRALINQTRSLRVGEVQAVVIDLLRDVNDEIILRFMQSGKFPLLEQYFQPMFDNREQVREAVKSEVR